MSVYFVNVVVLDFFTSKMESLNTPNTLTSSKLRIINGRLGIRVLEFIELSIPVQY